MAKWTEGNAELTRVDKAESKICEQVVYVVECEQVVYVVECEQVVYVVECEQVVCICRRVRF